MNRLPQCILCLCVLLVLLVCQATVRAQEKTFVSQTLLPKVPLPESLQGVGAIRLELTIKDTGGQGALFLDPNNFMIDDLGQVVGSSDLKLIKLDCTAKLVKSGKVRLGPNPPLDEERFLYEIKGKKITSNIFLLTAGKPLEKVNPTAHEHGWLMVKDDKGKITHKIRLSTPDISPCHPGCFPAGTLVHTPAGTRPIETIHAGDEVTVVCCDGTTSPGKVQSVFITDNRLLKVETEDGELFTTETQPLVLADGTTRGAGELKAGDLIYRWQNGKRVAVKVRAITPTNRLKKVFNLVLGDSEIFIAGGFLSRSKPPVLAAAPAQPAQLATPERR